MADPREQKLAKLLVNYSVKLQKGESCLINAVDVPITMTEALVQAVYEAGGYPVVNLWQARLERAISEGATEESLKKWADVDTYRMKQMDAFIGIRGIANVRELATIPEQANLVSKLYNIPVHMQTRVPHTKWVVLRYPTEIFAMQAGMGTTEFEDFFYKVCTEVDYDRMAAAMAEAKAYLDTVDKVHIKAPRTDLTFSVKKMGWIPCAGQMNIPDGEIYSCPVKDSVNGTITYNTESTYHGHCFKDVSLTFKDGKIVEAHADDDVLLNEIFDIDEGARYIGEFALGCNPGILKPMDNILFDEKILGSIHFTPGNAYDDCDNGNRSAVHWDLVQIQRPEYGGGEMYFDGELVRKDGLFVHPRLQCLNLSL
ncbi:aminopeptidase [Sphaerochaeta sp.]|uniref:aminopeptidase n=1 Tax=Sphaerochaeta sp. TaxID=1972642 RepID=UPI002FC63377